MTEFLPYSTPNSKLNREETLSILETVQQEGDGNEWIAKGLGWDDAWRSGNY